MVRAHLQDVVEVDKDEGQGSQNSVHYPMESKTSVLQTERHPYEAERHDDGVLGDVIRKHLNLVVALQKVEGRENMGASHVVDEVSNVWNLISVLISFIVQTVEVPTRPPRSIWFQHHKEGRGPRQISPPNNPCRLHLLKLGLPGRLSWRDSVESKPAGGGSRHGGEHHA